MRNMKMTVADLEAAKRREEHYGDHIAATCIGIVEEMVKLDRNLHDGLEKWTVEGGWRDSDGEIPDELAQINTEKFGCISNFKEGMMRKTDCDHIVALHNLWLKAVAAIREEGGAR